MSNDKPTEEEMLACIKTLRQMRACFATGEPMMKVMAHITDAMLGILEHVVGDDDE